ncbi:hypothetical protein D3C81_1102330 [compost metagenome]
MGRIRPPVQFQVEIAVPRWQLRLRRFDASEELRRRTIFARRLTHHQLSAVNVLQHFASNPATAVAMSVEQHLLRMDGLLTVGLPVLMNVLRQRILVYAMVQIRQHRRTVYTNPMEQIVREYVGIIPAKLGRHEITNPAML